MNSTPPFPAPPADRDPDWQDLPLFPLGTVLFPGGTLPLKVFEARYVDMTRECMKSGTPFGVCLIREGSEVGAPAVPHAIGCLAHIGAWDMPQLGVLHIRTRGTRRFRIDQTRVEAGGLLRSRAAPLPADPPLAVLPEFAALADVLKAILPRMPADRFPEPHRFDDASWLSNRLAEVLPISPLARQKLMELDDPQTRLSIIHQFLGQQGLK
ncbi:MAG: LON peptidase substrate-binding domain-containing protein [Burkholderiales bacterium]|nr:LON peptidase substrate-binding domain-containing protein [Burkholderiales bacterium]